jgi:hypothetical protein
MSITKSVILQKIIKATAYIALLIGKEITNTWPMAWELRVLLIKKELLGLGH